MVFDKLKLDRLSKIYGIDIDVQVVIGSGIGSPHLGLDRHVDLKIQWFFCLVIRSRIRHRRN